MRLGSSVQEWLQQRGALLQAGSAGHSMQRSLPGWQASQTPASRLRHAASRRWHGPACGIPQGEGRHARRRVPAARGLPSPASCQPAAGVGGKTRGGILWSFTYLSEGASGEGRRKVFNPGRKIKFLIVGRRCGTKGTTSGEYFMVVAQLLQPLLGKRCGWWVAPWTSLYLHGSCCSWPQVEQLGTHPFPDPSCALIWGKCGKLWRKSPGKMACSAAGER